MRSEKTKVRANIYEGNIVRFNAGSEKDAKSANINYWVSSGYFFKNLIPDIRLFNHFFKFVFILKLFSS